MRTVTGSGAVSPTNTKTKTKTTPRRRIIDATTLPRATGVIEDAERHRKIMKYTLSSLYGRFGDLQRETAHEGSAR